MQPVEVYRYGSVQVALLLQQIFPLSLAQALSLCVSFRKYPPLCELLL
jgi:hypothetical protein